MVSDPAECVYTVRVMAVEPLMDFIEHLLSGSEFDGKGADPSHRVVLDRQTPPFRHGKAYY
jgi:hypothetical protein